MSALLRRIAKPPPPATPSRAVRLAVTRAAERALGLPLAVLALREEEGPLDDLLARLEPGLALLALRRGGEVAGLVALDAEARAAAIEAQALGRIAAARPPARDATASDLALARPFLDAMLAEAAEALAGSPLEGWIDGTIAGDRLQPGEAPLMLADGAFRALRLTLDLGAGGREGLVLVLARVVAPPRDAAAPATVAPLALGAEARLDAVLHRLRMPLSVALGLRAGQVLPLPGVTVGSVRLESAGSTVGTGRLGQAGGMRAVRLEAPAAPTLAPLPPAEATLLPAGAWDAPPPAAWDAPGDPAPDEGAPAPAWVHNGLEGLAPAWPGTPSDAPAISEMALDRAWDDPPA